MLELTDEPNVKIAEYSLAKRMAELLQKHYPGHLWGVTCQSEQGIATIFNLRFSGNWGFLLKMKDIQDDPTLKQVVMAGGELLERYRVARGKFNEDDYAQKHTDFAGLFKADT
jgi:hypothetical protein